MEMAVKGTSRQVDGPCNFCPPRYVASISSQLWVGSSAKAWASVCGLHVQNPGGFFPTQRALLQLLHEHPPVIHLSSIYHPMIHQSPIAKSSTSTMDEDHIFEAIWSNNSSYFINDHSITGQPKVRSVGFGHCSRWSASPLDRSFPAAFPELRLEKAPGTILWLGVSPS